MDSLPKIDSPKLSPVGAVSKAVFVDLTASNIHEVITKTSNKRRSPIDKPIKTSNALVLNKKLQTSNSKSHNSNNNSTNITPNNNSNASSCSVNSNPPSNTSCRKLSTFDPYLKYELKSTHDVAGQFGQVTLVSSRFNPVLAMKKVDLAEIDDEKVLASMKTKIEQAQRGTQFAAQQAEHELMRLKAVEYERIVKFLKLLLGHTLKNASLVRIIDTFTARDLKSAYLVMDYYGENSLKTRLMLQQSAEEMIPIELVLKWFNQSVEGK